MTIYILILVFKIIENTLSTLRIIILSKGRKKLGAILQGIVATIWIFSARIIILNINDDIVKILAFILGSIIGSYVGSLIEENLLIKIK